MHLPTSDPTELYRYESLDGFLRVFWLVQSTIAGREDWARLAYESVIDGAEHGLIHREAFFTPTRHLANGQDLAAIAAVTGIDRVVGVGMDSTERGIDPASYRPAFEAARAAGFRLTAHQGENSPAAAIAACIDVLGVERIDHGLSIMEDAGLVARVAAAGIPLTVCPTSNVLVANAFDRLEDHVYPHMRHAGLLATLNTDDPALIDLDLAKEYGSVADAFGWGWQEMVAISLDGINACWLDDADKAALRQRTSAAAAALAPQGGLP